MSKITNIHVAKKFNLGNYESLELGCELCLDETDSVELATAEAANTINKMFKVVQHPEAVAAKPTPAPTAAPAPAAPQNATSNRKEIQFSRDHAIVQAIVNRVMKTGQPISDADKSKPQFAGMSVYPYVTMAELEKSYIFDDEAYKAINISITVGQKKL